MTMQMALARPAAHPPVALTATRAPNRVAERLTGRSYLSYSQISLMRSCPRRFAFQYLEGAPKDFLPSSLVMGGGIHSSLERLYRAKLEGRGVTRKALLIAYRAAWDRAERFAGKGTPVRFNRSQTRNTMHALAERMIDAFLASPLAEPKGVIVGIEEELRIVLDPNLPDMLARVDLVTVTDNALHVIDFKTSRGSWNEQRAQESGDQLVLYGHAVARMFQSLDLPVKLHFAVLTKHKTPRVQMLSVAAHPHRVSVMRVGVAQVWAAIQAGNFYPSPSPMHCATCPFKSKCPVFAQR